MRDCSFRKSNSQWFAVLYGELKKEKPIFAGCRCDPEAAMRLDLAGSHGASPSGCRLETYTRLLNRALGRLDLDGISPHVWAALLIGSVLLVGAITLTRVIAENSRAPLVLPAPTVTVTCPAPREAEALIITVRPGLAPHCLTMTGRAY